MSLLNQVLRELDARSAKPEMPELKLASVPEEPPQGATPQPARTDWLRLVAWTLAAGCAGVWLLSLWLVEPADRPPRAVPVSFDGTQALTSRQATEAAPVKEVVVSPLEQASALQTKTASRPQTTAEPAPLPVSLPVPSREPTSEPPLEPVLGQGEETSVAPRADRPEREAEPKLILVLEPEPEPGPGQAEEQASSAGYRDLRPLSSVVSKVPRAALGEKREVRRVDIEGLIATGELSRAETLLRARLDEDPGDARAHELMVGLLLRGGRAEDALRQIERSRVQAGPRLALELVASRLLIDQGDSSAAEQRLLKLLAQSPGQVEAMRMLAATWHAGKQFTRSAQLYRQLVGLPEANARDWLGLALSLDAHGDPAALRAFQRVVRDPSFEGAALRYAKQRIQQLQE